MTKRLPQSRIREFLDADPRELIRLHSYQCPEGWEAAQARGYLTGSHGHDPDDYFDYSYGWMQRAMAQRVPEFSGDLPVWAWLKRLNGKKRIRDPYVRITAMVPRARMLASCYDLWHMHLNNGFIPTSEAEYDEFESLYPHRKEPGGDAAYQAHTERNWDEVFNLRDPRSGYLLKEFGVIERVQICVDRIYLNEVVAIRQPDAALKSTLRSL